MLLEGWLCNSRGGEGIRLARLPGFSNPWVMGAEFARHRVI